MIQRARIDARFVFSFKAYETRVGKLDQTDIKIMADEKGFFEFETENEYLDARSKLDWYNAALEKHRGKNGWICIDSETSKSLPFADQVTNEMRSAIEVYEFKNKIPDTYFVYISETENQAQTWIGQKLGSVEFGRAYRSNFGDIRQPVTIRGINGKRYIGMYYKSAGDYARIKRTKNGM